MISLELAAPDNQGQREREGGAGCVITFRAFGTYWKTLPETHVITERRFLAIKAHTNQEVNSLSQL